MPATAIALVDPAMPTISSREIAELVESRHDSVKRAIERLAEKSVIGLPPTVKYLDSLGRKASEYRLGKRDSYVVVAQLSPEFTARLVDRWQELEARQPAPKLPGSYSAALRELATTVEVVERQQEIINKQAPKVEVFDRLESAEGDLVPSEAAKAIKTTRTACFQLIEELRWAFRRGGRWVGKADAERAGFVRHKTTIYRVDEKDHTRLQLVITPKGRNRLAQLLNEASAPASRQIAGPAPDLFGGLQ